MPPLAQACKTTISNLLQGETRTVTLVWNTTNWAYGNYTISATADTVPGETNTTNNTFNDGWVLVTILGDVNGDGKINVLDLIMIAIHLSHSYPWPHPPYSVAWYQCANTDLNSDGKHNVLDLIVCAGHLGQHW